MKKQMNVGKTIAVIVCALLLVLAVGSIAFFTNGFTSDFKTFYVESDGKRMLSDYDNYIMKQDTENDFVVSGNYTMKGILQRLYPEKEVSFNQDDVDNSVDNFTLLVYSYNGEAVIKISFHNYVAVEGVTLQEQLVFEVQPDGTIKAK